MRAAAAYRELLLVLLIVCHGLVASMGNEDMRLEVLDPEGYMDKVAAALETRVRAHGLANLPLEDAVMPLNRTVYGVQLLGSAFFTQGFVMSMDHFSNVPRSLQASTRPDNTGVIRTEILLPNVSVMYNLHAQLSAGNVWGTAVHTFPINRIGIQICFNMTSRTSKVVHIFPSAVSGPRTEYSPDSSITRAVSRVARLQASTVLWEDITRWITELFSNMFNSIVEEIDVPFVLS